MIQGNRVLLRPIRDEDWQLFEVWGQKRDAFWGPFQRFQLDHLPLLKAAYQKNSLLSRESAFLLIETLEEGRVIGFVRYTLISFPDADLLHPEIGFGITETDARGKGFAADAVNLLLGYLFSSYPTERVSALTDVDNLPAQRVLERAGFQREGLLRRVTFRDGKWCDLIVYGLLRINGYNQKRSSHG